MPARVRVRGGLWRRVFKLVSAEYADIESEALYVDMLAMDMVRRPERYRVIVTGNLFGDILSDLGSALVGGLGLTASGNIHPGRVSLFEPVHGSAPDIAGKGIANPVGQIWSGALMLEFLGYKEAGEGIVAAIERVLADKGSPRTPDLGGKASTTDLAKAIADAL